MARSGWSPGNGPARAIASPTMATNIRRLVSIGCVPVLATALAGCGVGGPSRSTVTSTGPAAPRTSNALWGTYHADLARSGVDPSGASFSPLNQAWVSPQLDGQVYAEPLVWGGLVIVATENDTIYALNAGNGSVAWSTHVATPVPQSSLPCGDINPLGITGTPAIDPATGHVFAVAETTVNGSVSHQLVALDGSTGRVLFQESVDPSGMTPSAQQERGALSVSGGRVYIPYGGLYGDCGSYHGWVVSAPTSGPGTLAAYQVPTAREGGIWAPPGASLDSAGNVWVATGNGSSTSSYDYGNSVLKLSPSLSLVDSFAPSNWASDNSSDSDLGSTGPMLLQNGLVFEVGKEQTGYLLSASHLGGIGGQLFSANVCFTIGAEAYRAPDVYVGCDSGIKDVHIDATNPPSFHVAWSGPSGATGPPIFAGGLVWSVGKSSQTLYGLDPSTGSAVVQQHLNATPASYSTPAVGDGLMVVGTGRTIEAFGGPPPTTAKYWMAASDGGVFNFGSAGFYGSAGNVHLARPIVGMAPTPDGNGYWLVASDGGIFTYGDAAFHGSTGAIRLNKPIVGMAATPDGNGYWLVASDGGIFTFGDAAFHGSTGAIRLNKPIVGMAATPDGNGYWLVASDGGIFTFGDAAFQGSAGGLPLARPVVGMAADLVTGGYWLAASDGGIFTYDAPFAGSAGNLPLAAPVVAIAGKG